MYRLKWMIIHKLNPNQNYLIDINVKDLAAKIRMPEEFIWQTMHEAALHNKSRLYVGFLFRAFTWAVKRLMGEGVFEETLHKADKRLDEIRQEVFDSLQMVVLNEGEDDNSDNDRSKAN